MICLFSHTLTEAQRAEAYAVFGVAEIIPLPTALQQLWSQVPPANEGEEGAEKTLAGALQYLSDESRPGDFVLVQGDFGLTFAVAAWCLDTERVPVYATTNRSAVETVYPDGRIEMKHTFLHAGFRRYRKFSKKGFA